MKATIKFIIYILAVVLLSGCGEPGRTYNSLSGYEDQLPAELKGLKVYTVETSAIGYVKVAILPNQQINSLTYPVGKYTQTTILINQNNNQERVVHGTIISENDSIIVIKK